MEGQTDGQSDYYKTPASSMLDPKYEVTITH